MFYWHLLSSLMMTSRKWSKRAPFSCLLAFSCYDGLHSLPWLLRRQLHLFFSTNFIARFALSFLLRQEDGSIACIVMLVIASFEWPTSTSNLWMCSVPEIELCYSKRWSRERWSQRMTDSTGVEWLRKSVIISNFEAARVYFRQFLPSFLSLLFLSWNHFLILRLSSRFSFIFGSLAIYLFRYSFLYSQLTFSLFCWKNLSCFTLAMLLSVYECHPFSFTFLSQDKQRLNAS